VKGNLEHTLGFLGSSIVLVGLFMPVFDIPAVGRVNYFANGLGDGIVLLLLVAGSVAALLTHRLWVLWLSGVSSLLLIGWNLVRVVLQPSVAVTQLSWGWPVLAIGGSLLIASAAAARREGATMPRFQEDVVVAALLLGALVVLGPTLFSGTRQAVSEFSQSKKMEERARWVPHRSARVEMVATMEQVRDDGQKSRQAADAEQREQETARRLRAESRRAAQVRLVSDIRRWYPQFAGSLRPVLDARRTFLEDYAAGGLAGAQSACAAVEQRVGSAREGLPTGPDRRLDGMTISLLDLYLASAESCRNQAGISTALIDLERAEDRIGSQLQALADSLATYCLRVPGDGGVPGAPSSVSACDPRDRASLAPGF
jgi:hypothetical protein